MRSVFITRACLLTVCLGACNQGERAGPRQFLSIGTAGTGGIYYPLGGAIASRLSVADPDHRYTAEVTGGSVENVNRIAKGEIDLGFSMGTTIFEAFHGGRDFAAPLTTLRVIAPLYPNLTHILIPRNSDATSLADLRGRRVSVGAPGSGTEQLARQILEAYDITYDDINVRYLTFRESADALRDGAIDGAIISVGYPASAVLEATTIGGAQLLPIEEEYVNRLIQRYPYYVAASIPADAYRALGTEIASVAVMNWIVGSEDLDSSVVHHLLDVLAQDRSELARVNTIANQIDLNALSTASVPLHSAARAWIERLRGTSDSGH